MAEVTKVKFDTKFVVPKVVSGIELSEKYHCFLLPGEKCTCNVNNQDGHFHCYHCHNNHLITSNNDVLKKKLDRHMKADTHQKNSKLSNYTFIRHFEENIDSSNCPEHSEKDYHKVVAEGAWTFHCAIHGYSFRSCTCTAKVIRNLFQSRFQCAETKAAVITKKVFGKFAKEQLKEEIVKANYITVFFDTSNHKHTKMLPILLQFFDSEKGIVHRCLTLKRLTGDSSQHVFYAIKDALKDIPKEKIIAICADNAPVNFGGVNRNGKKNVFFFLQREYGEDGVALIGIGCLAHIINNAINDAMKKHLSDFNLTGILSNLYSHFNGQTVRCEELFELCRKCGIDEMLPKSHTKIRWLSLRPSVITAIQLSPALGQIFLEYENDFKKLKGLTDKQRKKIQKLIDFFKDIETIPILHALDEMSSDFHKTILGCEGNNATAMASIENFRKLQQTCVDRSINFPIPKGWEKLSEEQQTELTAKFKAMYAHCAKYMSDWTSVWMTSLEVFQWATLNKRIDIENALSSVDFFERNSRITINNEELKQELIATNEIIEDNLERWNSKDDPVSSDLRWVEVFMNDKFKKVSKSSKNLRAVVEFLYALSATNASTERFFSEVNYYWSKQKGRLHLETVEAVMAVRYNITHDCLEMIDILRTNSELRNEVRQWHSHLKNKKETVEEFGSIVLEPLSNLRPDRPRNILWPTFDSETNFLQCLIQPSNSTATPPTNKEISSNHVSIVSLRATPIASSSLSQVTSSVPSTSSQITTKTTLPSTHVTPNPPLISSQITPKLSLLTNGSQVAYKSSLPSSKSQSSITSCISKVVATSLQVTPKASSTFLIQKVHLSSSTSQTNVQTGKQLLSTPILSSSNQNQKFKRKNINSPQKSIRVKKYVIKKSVSNENTPARRTVNSIRSNLFINCVRPISIQQIGQENSSAKVIPLKELSNLQNTNNQKKIEISDVTSPEKKKSRTKS